MMHAIQLETRNSYETKIDSLRPKYANPSAMHIGNAVLKPSRTTRNYTIVSIVGLF